MSDLDTKPFHELMKGMGATDGVLIFKKDGLLYHSIYGDAVWAIGAMETVQRVSLLPYLNSSKKLEPKTDQGSGGQA